MSYKIGFTKADSSSFSMTNSYSAAVSSEATSSFSYDFSTTLSMNCGSNSDYGAALWQWTV